MTLAEKLLRAAQAAHDDRELPTEFFERIRCLAASVETVNPDLLSTLITQLGEYDPYAGVGCFCEGATLNSLKETLSRIEA